MKIASWNVNGIRAVLRRGELQEYIRNSEPDILCLQEIKAQPEQVDLGAEFIPYHAFWNPAVRKGYAGTAIFTKEKPLDVRYGMGSAEHDQEGRILTAEFADWYLVTVYVPKSRRDLSRLAYRVEWDRVFLAYIQELERKKPVIFCGDLNAAHQEIDLARPESNLKNSGFTPEERAGFQAMLDAGFQDAFRWLHPEAKGVYTWWSYANQTRERNIGWRIDYFLLSAVLTSKIIQVNSRKEQKGSDHCPIELELKI